MTLLSYVGFPILRSISLGRVPGNDVVIPHSTVSARHAFVHVVKAPDGAKMAIEDRGSTQGTFLGEDRLASFRRCLLGSGESFRAGAILLKTMMTPGALLKGLPLRMLPESERTMMLMTPDFF